MGKSRGGFYASTEEGKRHSLEALAPPDVAHVKHGLSMAAGNLFPCDKCPCQKTCEEWSAGARCALEASYLQARRAQLQSVGHLEPVDYPAIDALLWTEVRLHRAARALTAWGETTPFADKAGLVEVQPLAREATRLLATWQNQLKALGLTPVERRRIAQDSEQGPAAQIARALAAISMRETPQAGTPVVDGEFVAKGEPGPETHEDAPGCDDSGAGDL